MQCDGLYRVGSENAKRRKTLESVVSGYVLCDAKLVNVLVDASYPLFYKRNRLVFYHFPYIGVVSNTINTFIIEVLKLFDGYKIVVLTPGLRAAKYVCDFICKRMRGTIESGSRSSIKLDGRNEVGAQWKVEASGICSTLVAIPPWDCNIKFVDGADLVICLNTFNECNDAFIGRITSLHTPCVFVTQKPSRIFDIGLDREDRWTVDGYHKDYQHYRWLKNVVSRLNLPREILIHIAGFAFRGEAARRGYLMEEDQFGDNVG
jgi:hypothetical protein